MDEIKQEMERQLGTAKAQLDEERKNQLETVKDVCFQCRIFGN